METTDIQGRKFPGYGRCIYCGCDGGDDGLGNEHIVPFSLGGNAEIEHASCRRCEGITSYLDGYLARHVFYEYRAHAGVQTRNPKQRPKSFQSEIVLSDRTELRDFQTGDHPYFLGLPVWGLPGILRGVLPSDRFEHYMVHIYYLIPENIRETLYLTEEEPLQIRRGGTINHTTFARAIAKIAYCHAVLHYGLDGFRPLVMPDLILGKYPNIAHFVGCEISDPPPPQPAGQLHSVNFSIMTAGRLRVIMVSVRLFAHSGTDTAGMPIYRVIIGAR